MIGWPLVTIFVLAIAASMAELASAYPTAGGLYYWASEMKNKNWGWWTAWLNLIGQFAIVAGINYAAAGFINATIVDRISRAARSTRVEIIPGILNGQLVTMGILMLIQLALNIAGINLVALLNQVSVWWHIGDRRGVVVLIFLAGKPDQSGLTLFAIQPQDRPAAGTTTSASSTSNTGRRSATRSSSRSSSRCSWPTGRTPAMTRRPTSPRRRSAPGSRAPGASSCRSRSARSSATSSWSR